MSEIYIEVAEPNGQPYTILTDFISMEAAVGFNTVGHLSITLPDVYDPKWFRRDMQMRVYQETPGYPSAQFANTTFFLNKISRRRQTITLEGPDVNMVLANAIIAYTGETTYADKTQEEWDLAGLYYQYGLYIDDMMRAFVRENLSTEALDADRNNSYIAVEEDRGLAPLGEKTASFQNLLSTLQDLARQSEEKGTPLYFSLYPNANDTYIFRVWSNQPRSDRSSTSDMPLVLMEENGDIDDVEEIYDWSEEGNVVYGLGGGSGSSRVYTSRTNNESLRGGPFSRREYTHDMPDVDHIDSANQDWVDGELGASLQGKKPRVRIMARINDGGDYAYGRDYAFGDKIAIVVGNSYYRQFDCYISAARISAQDGKVNTQIALSSVDFLT